MIRENGDYAAADPEPGTPDISARHRDSGPEVMMDDA